MHMPDPHKLIQVLGCMPLFVVFKRSDLPEVCSPTTAATCVVYTLALGQARRGLSVRRLTARVKEARNRPQDPKSGKITSISTQGVLNPAAVYDQQQLMWHRVWCRTPMEQGRDCHCSYRMPQPTPPNFWNWVTFAAGSMHLLLAYINKTYISPK